MSEDVDVAVFVGSLRRDSFTKAVVRAMASRAPAALKLEMVEIADLTLYNQDLEGDPPRPWVALRERIKRADAVLFATPEYNRSIPAALKNVIDIGSRPVGASSWAGKPAATMSVSPGVMGAFGANQHLRQSLGSLNVPLLPSPEVYIGGVTKLLDSDGQLPAATAEFLEKFLRAFESWVRRIKA